MFLKSGATIEIASIKIVILDNLIQSLGWIEIGNSHPNADTLTYLVKIKEMATPKGIANIIDTIAKINDLKNSWQAKLIFVIPIAQAGAS